MPKPHPTSVKEIQSWFIPGKLYSLSSSCMLWYGQDEYGPIAEYADDGDVVTFLYSESGDVMLSIKLYFLDGITQKYILYSPTAPKGINLKWISGITEL